MEDSVKHQNKKDKRKRRQIQNRKELRQYFFAVRNLTGREIKRKYARSYLGILWSVLNPLLSMVVISLVFSKMFRRAIDYFPLYYLTGQMLWSFFSTATNASMNALVDNKSLLIRGKLPKYVYVLSRIYTALVNLGYSMIAYVVILLFFQISPYWTMLLFPLDMVLLLFFAMGIGLMLSILYVFFADIRYLYHVILTLWLYLSAIFYPVDRLPRYMTVVVENNPVYLAIAIARDSLIYSNEPEFLPWLKLAIWAVCSMGIGVYVFHKYENQVMQKI